MDETSEKRERLWLLAASPGLWAAHFLLSYGTAAVWCAKLSGPDASLTPARVAIAAYTAVALALIAVLGWRGRRRHLRGQAPLPHDEDSAEDRHRFLGFAVLLLSALSAVAVVYGAMAALFIGSCR